MYTFGHPIAHIIDLSVPCKLPFDGAERVNLAKSGVVKLRRRGDGLCLGGVKLSLFLSENQKGGKVIGGHELRKELEARGNNLSAKILDYLEEHSELWPGSWKRDEDGNTIYVYFWDDIFRGPSSGRLCIRFGVWRASRVVSSFSWLDLDWNRCDPAASLTS